MTLDLTYGNMTEPQLERMYYAVGEFPDQLDHEPGCTEPWVSKLVADFVVARGARRVLETGSFLGATSVWLFKALVELESGFLVCCDIDPKRQGATFHRLSTLAERIDPKGMIGWGTEGDVMAYLAKTPMTFDIAFVDDNHEKKHVRQELTQLYPKMNPGGLILLHDVYGVCDLKTVVQEFGGYSIDLPRMGPAGGLGVIQV